MSSLLFSDNFLSSDVVSNATASSEQSAFPADNLYNAQRRSKVWRSDGYFEIDASNKDIVFQETDGIDLDTTLDEGSYSSASALFAAIKAKMEAATGAGSTYTITQDATTNKVVFTSNGAGGGNIFKLRWTQMTGLASTLGFDSSADDTGALTYTADALRISTGEWLKWDMGISSNPQAFILIGKRNSPIAITPSATIKLQGNETDNWTSPSYEKTLTYDDRAIIEIDDNGLHTEALRYWRFLVEDLNNPQGYVELGAAFLGDYFKGSTGKPQFPFTGQYSDRSRIVTSEGGQLYADELEQTERFSLTWFGLTIAEKELLDTFFTRFGKHSPFFVSFDPNSAFSSSANYYVRYVRFDSEPAYGYPSPGVYEMTMTFREDL